MLLVHFPSMDRVATILVHLHFRSRRLRRHTSYQKVSVTIFTMPDDIMAFEFRTKVHFLGYSAIFALRIVDRDGNDVDRVVITDTVHIRWVEEASMIDRPIEVSYDDSSFVRVGD